MNDLQKFSKVVSGLHLSSSLSVIKKCEELWPKMLMLGTLDLPLMT